MGFIPDIWSEEVITGSDTSPAAAEVKGLLDFPPELVPDPQSFLGDYHPQKEVIDLVHSPRPLDYIPQTFTATSTANWPTWAAGYKDTAVDWLRRQVEEICAAGRSNL